MPKSMPKSSHTTFIMTAEQFHSIKMYFLTLFLGLYHLLTLILWLPMTIFELRHYVKQLYLDAVDAYRKGNKYSRYLLIFIVLSVIAFIITGILCWKMTPFIPDLAEYEAPGGTMPDEM